MDALRANEMMAHTTSVEALQQGLHSDAGMSFIVEGDHPRRLVPRPRKVPTLPVIARAGLFGKCAAAPKIYLAVCNHMFISHPNFDENVVPISQCFLACLRVHA